MTNNLVPTEDLWGIPGTGFIDDGIDILTGGASSVVNSLSGGLQSLFSGDVEGLGTGLLDSLGALVETGFDLAGLGLGTADDIVAGLLDGAISASSLPSEVLSALFGDLGGFGNGVPQKLDQVIAALGQLDGTPEAIEGIRTAILALELPGSQLDQIEAELERIGTGVFHLRNSIEYGLDLDIQQLGDQLSSSIANVANLVANQSQLDRQQLGALFTNPGGLLYQIGQLVATTNSGFDEQASAIDGLANRLVGALVGFGYDGEEEYPVGNIRDSLNAGFLSVYDGLSGIETRVSGAIGGLTNQVDIGFTNVASELSNLGDTVVDLGNGVTGSLNDILGALAQGQFELSASLASLVEAVTTQNTIDATGDAYYLDFTSKGLDKVVGFNPLPRRREGGDELTVYAEGMYRNGASITNVQDRKGLKKAMVTDVDLIYRRDKDLLYWNADGEDRGMKLVTDDGLRLGGRVARIRFDDDATGMLRSSDINFVPNPLDLNPGDVV